MHKHAGLDAISERSKQSVQGRFFAVGDATMLFLPEPCRVLLEFDDAATMPNLLEYLRVIEFHN